MCEPQIASSIADISWGPEEVAAVMPGYQECLSPGGWIRPQGLAPCSMRVEFQGYLPSLEITSARVWAERFPGIAPSALAQVPAELRGIAVQRRAVLYLCVLKSH